MTYTIHHLIQNKLVHGEKEFFHPLCNPATGEKIGEVAYATSQQVEQAIQAAKKAFSTWSAVPPIRRAKILFKYKELLEKNLDELAVLVTKEHGKTITDAKGSIMRGIELVELACNIPYLLKGWFSEDVGPGIDSYTLRQPLGVCVGITPFNFPAMIPLWMFPMAIACGNTFILKPSEKDPSCPLRLAELFVEAGAPESVLNVVNGDQEVVNQLLTHQDIAAVSFVGSTPVAEYIQKTAIQYGKRVQAFGGAKNHAVVMPDADLEQVAEAVVGAAYGSAGERCMALSVVVTVGEKLGDELVSRILPKVQALKIGVGTDPNIEMGPLITSAHLERVKNYIDLGVKEGAKLLIDGRHFTLPGCEKGFYLGGSLFDHVKSEMKIYKEEIFGPVLCVMRVNNLNEAIELVNQNEFGNGTAIFTSDGGVAREYASRVKVGMVGINVPIPVPAPFHAFGGWKRSSFADIGMHGSESVNFYTHLKTVTARWPKEKSQSNHFVMPTH